MTKRTMKASSSHTHGVLETVQDERQMGLRHDRTSIKCSTRIKAHTERRAQDGLTLMRNGHNVFDDQARGQRLRVNRKHQHGDAERYTESNRASRLVHQCHTATHTEYGSQWVHLNTSHSIRHTKVNADTNSPCT